MRRYLIVVNRAIAAIQLARAVEERVQRGPATFAVLVPVAPGELPEDEAARAATLHERLAPLRDVGATIDARVVDDDPTDAVLAALAGGGVDEVLVCTLPPGLSTWLRDGLLTRVRAATSVPVVHLTAPAGLAARLTVEAVRLTIYLGESDRVGRRSLYTEIVHRARDAGLAGATVVRGVEGFGGSQVLHTARLLTMSEDLPIVIHLVDTADRIDAFLPVLDELLTEGLVVRDHVEVIKYAGREGS